MKITTPEELGALMGWDFAPSPEQWEAIRAPLEPAVVIAGAGSGKTTLMAARVVYLVATEQVRPDQVLGLTFTTKAASQLRGDLRAAKVQRQEPQRPGDDGSRTVELQLAEAVRRVRDEEFPARAGKHCDHCDFTALCPTKRSGTVLS